MTNTLASFSFHVHRLLRAKNWQPRIEYDDVCEWWNNGGHGVYALIGLGGSGKTAIAEHFLNSLPGLFPRTNLFSKNTHQLRQTPAVFVYSFYDDDKPASFMQSLQMWLEGDARVESPLSVTQTKFLMQRMQGLIVLDGLEVIQESNERGFGQIESPQVRELLNHIACGACKNVSVLLTSRFPLTDLRDSDSRFYKAISVSGIPIEAGIQLLKERGVRGSDLQLTKIVRDCGQHALTIDLAGGFISEFGNGDPEINLDVSFSALVENEIENELDPSKRGVLKQGLRFLAIAQHYRQAMQQRDEASLAILERICMFSRGASLKLIKEIFTGPDKESISGRSLASLDPSQLTRKLDWLVRLKIIEKSELQSTDGQSTEDVTYMVHPAVRDGFLKGIADHQKSILHEAIGQGLALTLGTRPGNRPIDKPTLDLLEEVVFHTLQNGNVDAAWNIYQNRMGGCHNLLAQLSDYERTERITGAILHLYDSRREGLTPHEQVILLSDHGYASLELGKSLRAEEVLNRGLRLSRDLQSNIKTLTGNLCYLLYQRGKLKTLGEQLKASLPFFKQKETQLYFLQEIAEADTMRGKVSSFVYDEALLPSIEQTGRKLEETKRTYPGGHQSLAVAQMQFAEALLLNKQFERATQEVSCAFKWADAHDANTLQCWGDLLNARIQLAEFREAAGDKTNHNSSNQKLQKASCFIESGLRIARNSGYSLYHIELLLEKAKLALLRGDPQSALLFGDEAMNVGVKENTDTGQLQLFAASDDECQHAWSIPVGLQIEAEAKLLQAAQLIQRENWSSFDNEQLACLDPDEKVIQRRARALIEQAELKLLECLEHWHLLRDPTQGSLHNLTIGAREYCFRAADANKVLQDLRVGVLTRNPLIITEQVCSSNDSSGLFRIDVDAPKVTHEECLKSFVMELERYDEFFSASIGDLVDDEFAIDVDHRLNVAATQLASYYPSRKLPAAPRHAFRKLLRLPGRNQTWESVEMAIEELTIWARGEVLEHSCGTQKVTRVDQKLVRSDVMPNDVGGSVRFSFALSFPGEHRDLVFAIACELAKSVGKTRVFYDEWYETDLLGNDGDLVLTEMYKNAEIVVPFFSKFYGKPWCGLEWGTIRGILLEQRKRRPVIPVHLDDTEIPGWNSVDFGIKLRGRSPREIADVILGVYEKRVPIAGSPIDASLDPEKGFDLCSDQAPEQPRVHSEKSKGEERCFPTICTTLPAVYQCICVRGQEFFAVTWDSANCVELSRQKVTAEFAAQALSQWKSYAPETYSKLFPALVVDQSDD
jgi:hypothetical protein